MSSTEIEDVLSSIRRLVSEELRPLSRSGARAGAAPGEKLILTPAFRVVDRAAPDAPRSVGPRPPVFGDPVTSFEALLAEAAPDRAPTPPREPETVPDPVQDSQPQDTPDHPAAEGPQAAPAAQDASPAPADPLAWDGPAHNDEPAPALPDQIDAPAAWGSDTDAEPVAEARVQVAEDANPAWDQPSADTAPDTTATSILASVLADEDGEWEDILPGAFWPDAPRADAAGSDRPADWPSDWPSDLPVQTGAEAELELDLSQVEEAEVISAITPGEAVVAAWAAEATDGDEAHIALRPAEPPAAAPGLDPALADQAEADALAELLGHARPGFAPPADPGPEAAPGLFDDEEPGFDEDALRELVRDIIREELQGTLGERITRNVRKLVRAEINRALVSRDFD